MIERTCKRAHTRGKKSLLTALIAGCIAVAPATAGTIGIDGNTLVIGAEPSDAFVNLLGMGDGTNFTLMAISGAFDIVTPGCSLGMTGIDFNCSGFTSLLVIGSDGDDVFSFSLASVAATLAGGLGNDIILGTSATDSIFGGSGDDVISAAATDFIFGGLGDDIVLGGLDLGDADAPPFDPLPRPPVSVPEPGSLLLLLAGLGVAAATRYRGKRRASRYC
jgi:hypothetical protein